MKVLAKRREMVLALVTVIIALFGGSWLLVRSRIDEWRQLRRREAELLGRIQQDKHLVSQRAEWEERFTELHKLLPQFSADDRMEVHWLSFMDRVAAKHGVLIRKRTAKGEEREGDVYEIPIEVPHDSWEGTLDGLIHFLYDLQSEGVMLDVRQLLVKPKGREVLKGRFILHCAYTRESKGTQP